MQRVSSHDQSIPSDGEAMAIKQLQSNVVAIAVLPRRTSTAQRKRTSIDWRKHDVAHAMLRTQRDAAHQLRIVNDNPPCGDRLMELPNS